VIVDSRTAVGSIDLFADAGASNGSLLGVQKMAQEKRGKRKEEQRRTVRSAR
jgi:hypothetical protein